MNRTMRIVSFESRRSSEMAQLIEEHGGQALIAPALREVPLRENDEALRFGKKLIAGDMDMVIFTTGVGAEALFSILEAAFSREKIMECFAKISLIARGPKTLAALEKRGLQAQAVPEPGTCKDVLAALPPRERLQGKKVAIQEYGSSNEELIRGIVTLGARIIRVPVYRWTLPED